MRLKDLLDERFEKCVATIDNYYRDLGKKLDETEEISGVLQNNFNEVKEEEGKLSSEADNEIQRRLEEVISKFEQNLGEETAEREKSERVYFL